LLLIFFRYSVKDNAGGASMTWVITHPNVADERRAAPLVSGAHDLTLRGIVLAGIAFWKLIHTR
jgi:hypothetical protein